MVMNGKKDHLALLTTKIVSKLKSLNMIADKIELGLAQSIFNCLLIRGDLTSV